MRKIREISDLEVNDLIRSSLTAAVRIRVSNDGASWSYAGPLIEDGNSPRVEHKVVTGIVRHSSPTSVSGENQTRNRIVRNFHI